MKGSVGRAAAECELRVWFSRWRLRGERVSALVCWAACSGGGGVGSAHRMSDPMARTCFAKMVLVTSLWVFFLIGRGGATDQFSDSTATVSVLFRSMGSQGGRVVQRVNGNRVAKSVLISFEETP